MSVREVEIINFTGHEVIILDSEVYLYNGIFPKPRIVIPPSGLVARARYDTRVFEKIRIKGSDQEMDITRTEYGDIYLLDNMNHSNRAFPEPKPNTYYIVSKLVADILFGKREDLLVLSSTIKDPGTKKIIGGKSLAKLAKSYGMGTR